MTRNELRAKVNFKPAKVERKKIEYSSKLTPYQDNERDFCGYINRPTSNVLAEKNYDTALAMCKDAK